MHEAWGSVLKEPERYRLIDASDLLAGVGSGRWADWRESLSARSQGVMVERGRRGRVREAGIRTRPTPRCARPARGWWPAGQAGFYAWWIRGDTIAGLPHHPHPTVPGLGLLYVGISPMRQSSAGLIRLRVIDQHVRGNTSSSTFRFVLASMLLEQLELKPRSTIKKVVLDSDDNVRLRQWQFDNSASPGASVSGHGKSKTV